MVGCSDRLGDARALNAPRGAGLASSGSGTRTRDTAIMSRLLYRLSYPAVVGYRADRSDNAPGGADVPPVRGGTGSLATEPPCGIEPQTFSLPWRRSAY